MARIGRARRIPASHAVSALMETAAHAPAPPDHDAATADDAPRVGAARIDALTGLRFVAALLVYLSHIPYMPTGIPKWITEFMLAGFNGVTLFFVLSGFVICYNYYERVRRDFRGSLRPFFVARFARVYPMYLFMFLFYATTTNVGQQAAHQLPLILQHLTMTQAWNRDVRAAFSYNGVAWSVSVEAFLYVTFPLIVVLLLRRLARVWLLVALGALAFGAVFAVATQFSVTGNVAFAAAPHYWLYRLPLTRLGDFILGCVAARIFMLRSGTPVTRRERMIGIGALLGAIGAVVALMETNRPYLVPYRFDSGYSLFFAVIVFCLARYAMPLSRFLSLRPLLLLGEASYSFYLMHAFFLLSMSADGGRVILLHNLLIFVLIASAALGACTYIETPARRFLRARLSGRARADTAALPAR